MQNTNAATKIENFGQRIKYMNNHPNAKMILSSAALFGTLSDFFRQMRDIMKNNSTMRNFVKDYKRVELIIRNINASNNLGYLIFMLKQHVAFIGRYDAELARFISSYGTSDERHQRLGQLTALINNTPALIANVDYLMEWAESIGNKATKEKVVARIRLIKRHADEIRVLGYDLQDVNMWDRHVHSDISFFTDSLKAYFEGNKPEDTRQFAALNGFKDEALRKNVEGSREIRALHYLSNYTYRVEAQLEFISRLISQLQTDIRLNVWVRNVTTRDFYKHIEENAETFRTDFRNNAFADSLIMNKKKIGEQPFAWIAELNKMKKLLEQFTSMKNTAIANASKSLSNIFRQRIESLKASISNLSSQLIQLLGQEMGDLSVLEKIKDRLKGVKLKIKKELKVKRKKSFELGHKIGTAQAFLIPKIMMLSERYDITNEGKDIIRANIGYTSHQVSLGQISASLPSQPSIKHMQHLAAIAWNAKRMQDYDDAEAETQRELLQKDDEFINQDLAEVKNEIDGLLNLYEELLLLIGGIEWIDLDLHNKINDLITKVRKFRGVDFGKRATAT